MTLRRCPILMFVTLAMTAMLAFVSSHCVSACDSCIACRSAHAHAAHRHSPGEPNRGPAIDQCKPDSGDDNLRSGSFRFGVVGDTQGLQYVEQLITDMNAHDPSLVVFPGDLVSSGNVSSWGQWDQLTRHFVGGVHNRLMVPGNHDLPVGGDVSWQQTFNWLPDSQPVGGVNGIDQMDYFVDFGNTRFVSVTTDSQANGAGGPPPAQQWLDNLLNDPATQAKDHVFVYSHHPVTFNNYDGTGGTQGAWWQSMGNAENVTGLFVGHWHQYQPSQPHPHHYTWEVVSGTGNSGFSGHPWQNEVGYSIVEVDGQRATLKFYGDSDGDGRYDNLLDSLVMTDRSPPPVGVVAYYGFEDAAMNRDTALTELSKVNSGEYFGNASIVAGGAIGNALALDGNDDYANGRGIGDYNMAILRDLTVSINANFMTLGGGPNDNTLVSYTADVAGYTDREEAVNQPYNFRIRGDGRLQVFWEHDNNEKEFFVSTVPANVNAGQWHEYRFTRDATTGELNFYVDGSQLGETLAFDPLTELPTGGAQGTLRMGINYDRNHPSKLVGEFDGMLDELILWNQVSLDTYTGPLAGDVNLDGTLDQNDMSAFVDGWMTVMLEDDLVTRWGKGDLDLDGSSDLDDLVIFQQALQGAGLVFTGFPEPSSCSLAWFALTAMMMCRTRDQAPTSK